MDYRVLDAQNELQEYVEEKMVLRNRTISTLFYAIDEYYTEQFFIYLDEGDNLKVYEVIS